MTETEKKALALVNEVRAESRGSCADRQHLRHADMEELEAALCRAIEQHEAFQQEVSDAVESRWMNILAMKCEDVFSRFIIAKPDPLVEIWNHMIDTGNFGPDALRNAMKDRGYEWTKTSESNNES